MYIRWGHGDVRLSIHMPPVKKAPAGGRGPAACGCYHLFLPVLVDRPPALQAIRTSVG